MSKLLLVVALLALVACAVAIDQKPEKKASSGETVTGWLASPQDNKDNKVTYTRGKFTLEVWTVKKPLYDHERMVRPEAAPTPGENSEAAKTQMENNILHHVSFAVRLSVQQDGNNLALYSLYEGSAPDVASSLLKLDMGVIHQGLVRELTTEVASFDVADKRLQRLVRKIPQSLKYSVSARPSRSKSARSSRSATPEKNSRGGRSPAPGERALARSDSGAATSFLQQMATRFRSGKAAVQADMGRYEVHLYTGRAFGVAGEHSATRIVLRRSGDNAVMHQHDENNHGRGPTDNGIAFKCTHLGPEFELSRNAVTTWSCVSPYWAFWCLRGPNHNCNANAMHQINIANNPTAPPKPEDDPICKTDCPIYSANCNA